MSRGVKKGKRGRKHTALPKMFRRGPKGIFYFRRWVSGKDRWINLGSDDEAVAKDELLRIVDSHDSIKALSKVESSNHKLAEVFVEGVTGKKAESIALDDAYAKWASITPGYGDIGANTRSFYETIFKRFTAWAKERGLSTCAQVNRDHALEYARSVWDSGIGGKTYNDHLMHLSRVFSAVDAVTPLPNRDPFDRKRVLRKRKAELGAVSHEALEPAQLEAVLREAARQGRDWRDLFIIGAHTGMRLKDAAKLEWKSVGSSFIAIMPHKTEKVETKARVPISKTLAAMLAERMKDIHRGRYVIQSIAAHYESNADFIVKKSKSIFNDALGEETTSSSPGKHRQRAASIFSFHSFRTTYVSLLARQNAPFRDVQRMLGWTSAAMIRVYERELERTKGDADTRALKLIDAMDELNMELPPAQEPEKPLRPTASQLRDLAGKYSNVSLGRIYGVSEAAVRKWFEKHCIVREGRIQSDISDEEAAKVRAGLESNA